MNIIVSLNLEQQEKLSYIQEKSGIDVTTLFNQAIEKQYENLQNSKIDLKSREINQEEAQNLRENLATFADDWNNPEMSIYDAYEQNRVKIESR